jgi:tetratricopeptide (TPR) repeat protein
MRKYLALLAVLCLLAAACIGSRPSSRWLGLDTAQYHLQTGMLFLEWSKPEDARRELMLAVELDPNCGLAYCGLTAACAELELYPEAKEYLGKARKLAKDDTARCQTDVAALRLLLAERPPGWIEAALGLYEEAHTLPPNDKAPAYFLALCQKAALRLDKAEELFREVALAGGPYSKAAADEWRLVERALRCTPRTDLGRELAPRAALTRAELAALLAAELGVGKPSAAAPPADLAQHRLRDQVLPVMSLGLGPLRPFADGTFAPDALVTRAEFAQVAEALLLSWSPGGLHWRQPQAPPYPDVAKETSGCRAVTLCGTRGLLEVRDLLTGAIEPSSPLSGADALLAIGRLREQRGAR